MYVLAEGRYRYGRVVEEKRRTLVLENHDVMADGDLRDLLTALQWHRDRGWRVKGWREIEQLWFELEACLVKRIRGDAVLVHRQSMKFQSVLLGDQSDARVRKRRREQDIPGCCRSIHKRDESGLRAGAFENTAERSVESDAAHPGLSRSLTPPGNLAPALACESREVDTTAQSTHRVSPRRVFDLGYFNGEILIHVEAAGRDAAAFDDG